MANEENLKPAQPGEVRNPKGKPKGTRSLATIIRDLEKEDFDWSKLPTKQSDAIKSIGSPFKVIVYVALSQAVDGDRHAREWLRKAGYGDKLSIDAEVRLEQPILGGISVSGSNGDEKDSQPQE